MRRLPCDTMSPLLESIFGSLAYDAIKAALGSVFADTSDELAKRLFKAFDVAMERFDEVHGERFGGARDSFLGRLDNLKVVAGSLHFSQPQPTPGDFVPQGFGDAPDATPEEIAAFLDMLDAEIRQDPFLDKHFREKEHMAQAAETARSVEETKQMLEAAFGNLPTTPPSGVPDPWADTDIVDPAHPAGWQPEQGQIYAARFSNGASINYMFHGALLGVEYTHPDGMSSYVDVDAQGNIHNQRLPYPLVEYRIEIPEDLVVRRNELALEDGGKTVDVTLKWGNRVRYTIDESGALRGYQIKGPSAIRNKKRIVEILPPGYLDKKARGEV